MKNIWSFPLHFFLFIFLSLFSLSCFDVKVNDSTFSGDPVFVSGPEGSTGHSFARGIIEASGESLGVIMKNTVTTGTVSNAEALVNGEAYMGLVQEDIFRYAGSKYLAQYENNPDTAEKKYLKIPAKLKIISAVYRKHLYLLVKGSITCLNDIVNAGSSMTINVGAEHSDTYMTAQSIIEAWSFDDNANLTFSTNDAVEGIQNVVDGTCDAAFLVAESPSSLLQSIPKTAAVELIKVTMPEGKKYYREDGQVFKDDYAFQNTEFDDTVTVKTLVASGPMFSDRVVDVFINHLLANSDEYTSFNALWGDYDNIITREYMMDHPTVCNYKSLCHFMGVEPLDTFYLEPYLASGTTESVYHDMATELIWLLSHNMDVDLREKNTTGSWENSYWMLYGKAAMALVQDDLYSYLTGENCDDEGNTEASVMQAASMKKIAPLNYDYVHLVVSTDGNKFSSIPTNIEKLFTLGNLNGNELHINLGPKTSGTFITAMEIINSYKAFDSDGDGIPDMEEEGAEEIEIHYYFDSPADAVAKVASATAGGSDSYHASFVVSGLPYHRFYSHDTYSLPSNIRLIPARFFDTDSDGEHLDDTPWPYREGIIKGTGTAIYENYPYPVEILPADITTVRVRSLLVSSPAFDESDINWFMRSIFRKAYYKVHPLDPDDPDYMADPMWLPVIMESYSADNDYFFNSNTYGETIIGAKEYFVKNPTGWSDAASDYYLSFFPDN